MATDNKMTMGKILRFFRLASGKKCSITELAEKMGVSKAYISAVETDKRDPGLKVLKRFSKVFNVPRARFVQILDDAEENNWTYAETMLEVQKIYLEFNSQE